MDIIRTLRELYEEKKHLDAAIARLETRLRTTSLRRRRGRKSMGAAERQEVSRRMKRYWEARRAQRRALKRDPESRSAAGQSAFSA